MTKFSKRKVSGLGLKEFWFGNQIKHEATANTRVTCSAKLYKERKVRIRISCNGKS